MGYGFGEIKLGHEMGHELDENKLGHEMGYEFDQTKLGPGMTIGLPVSKRRRPIFDYLSTLCRRLALTLLDHGIARRICHIA